VQLDGREPQQPDALGRLLRDWREEAGLTQEQLAERTRLSVRTIRALECGQALPRAATVRLLGAALGLDEPARVRLLAAAARPPRAAGRPAVPAAALGSPAVVPAQLPAEVASFTGRSQYLRQLDALLAGGGAGGRQGDGSGQAVMIGAIAGTAGVGKTALAVHWAHQVRGRFPDGQLYVNLHGWAHGRPLSPLQALAQLLGALGVEPSKIPVEVDQAAGLYRSLLADRRVLVVLDNARNAEQVRPLVPGAAGCLVVVTSRDGLSGLVASHGARRLALDVLTLDEAVGLLAWIVGEGRIHAEPEAAAGLAEVCGYLPLALRIVAANLTGQPDQPIAGWLARLRAGDRLAELVVAGDPLAAVGTAFDCSYAVLEADAQRLFRLLGLVPGGDFTAQAAGALAGLPVGQAGWLLERLAGAHLIEPRAVGRFGFHDLLRLYARRRVEEDSAPERQQARNRLLGWYLHTTDTADRLIHPQMLRLPVPPAGAALPAAGFDDRLEALEWLDRERRNLVAAVQHAATHGPRPLAWLLADALRGYFWASRHVVDWLAVADAGLAAADAAGDPQAQAAGQRNLGLAHYCLGDYARAAECHSSARLLARQAGWTEGEAAAVGALAMVHTMLGQLQQAADHYAQQLALNRQIGSKAGQAVTLGNLADVQRELGWPELALEHLAQALALHREVGARSAKIAFLCQLGEVYDDLGRLDAASEHLSQALTLAREAGNRYLEAYGLSTLAVVHRDAGRSTAALALAEDALALAREIGDPRVEADTLNTLGSIHLSLGRGQQAAEHHCTALELARQTSASYPETEALLGLAATCQRQGQHTQALEHAELARTLACEASFRILEGRAHGILAATHLDLDHHDEAVGHALQALAVFRETCHRLGHARALVVLGHAMRRTGNASAARSHWREALLLLTDVGAPDAAQVRMLLSAW
jgi:tetratricopeptide (TPR) repeat protein/transcriptional regulator with XRE-family HTH domain